MAGRSWVDRWIAVTPWIGLAGLCLLAAWCGGGR
jgi:hypothetical protein